MKKQLVQCYLTLPFTASNKVNEYSFAQNETLACPCLPVFDVDMSTILHALPLSTTKPFLRRAEHCSGYVSDAPDVVLSNSPASAMVRSYQSQQQTQQWQSISY